MKLRSILLAAAASLLTGVLVAQGQVPGAGSTLNAVFTLAYDQSTMKPTFSAAKAGITPVAGANTICLLNGSATKTIKVRRVIVSGNANVAGSEPVSIIKYSTNPANLASASALVTMPAYDSTNGVAGAVAEVYTGLHTVGTYVGVLADIYIPIGSGTVQPQPYAFTFGALGQPAVLRGIAQAISVDLGYVSYTLGQFSCVFEWTEE